MNKIFIGTLIISTMLLAKTELQEGEYSWFKGGSQAFLTIIKSKDGNYTIKGECYYGVARKYGPNIGNLDFNALLKDGKIVYTEEEYRFILTANKDGSFDVHEEGATPFGHNASFGGHFTSDKKPSFSCKKATTSIEHVICENEEIAKLDKVMARAYTTYKSAFFFEKSRASLENKLNREQQNWLKSRNACVSKEKYKSCLIESYKSRIKRLEEQFGNFWKYE